MNTLALERLRAFRHAIYTTIGCRRDALVEILDALLTVPVIAHPVYLSLAPGFQRTWGSIYDALNAGSMPLSRLEHLVTAQPLETSTAWYAVDASVWPRCDAETSPQRGYYHHHTRQSHGQPIVAGWNYSWLVQIPERCSSWTAPLRVRRMLPGENVTQVAAEQIRSFLHQRGPGQPSPICTFDAGYEPAQLGVALAGLDVSVLVLLRSGRCFYADPPPGPTGGRPRRHGSKFVCDNPTTWPAPTSQWSTRMRTMGRCGSSAGAACTPSHTTTKSGERARLVPLSAAPSSAWRSSTSPDRPKCLYPSGSGGAGQSPLIWRPFGGSMSRGSPSNTPFASANRSGSWTTPKLRSPEAADRWTWLVMLAYVQLRLARPLVVDQRLPWQAPLPTGKLTPARVRRAFSYLVPTLGRLASVPKPSGRSPGRPKGRRSAPAKRFPAVKLTA